MPSRDEVKEESEFNSSRISETSRYVGFGLLATYYALKVDPTNSIVASTETWLVTTIGVFGALAVVLDYFQYLFGYLMARAALNDSEYRYHQGFAAIWFPLKTIAFVAKQVAAVVGSLAVILLILCA